MKEYFDLLYKKYNKMTLTKKELAAELSISERTIDRLVKTNDLPIAMVAPNGGKLLYPIKSVAIYLDSIEEMAV